MKKLADYGIDDHPADDPERVQINWIVAALATALKEIGEEV